MKGRTAIVLLLSAWGLVAEPVFCRAGVVCLVCETATQGGDCDGDCDCAIGPCGDLDVLPVKPAISALDLSIAAFVAVGFDVSGDDMVGTNHALACCALIDSGPPIDFGLPLQI